MTKTLDELMLLGATWAQACMNAGRPMPFRQDKQDDIDSARAALESALRELITDAERYRWWRAQWCQPDPMMPDALVHAFTAPELDAAIDAARATAAPPLPTSEQA